MLNYEVKFLSCDEELHLKNGDFKSYKYETKKRNDESVYDAGKRGYCERRGGCWRAPRARQIRQLEAKLRDRAIVHCVWTSDTLLTIIFSSGAIAYLTIKPQTLDVTQILFDRYCLGKLCNPNITGVVLCKTHLLFVHTDRTATLVSFGKNINQQPCRISDRDPHIQSIEIGGGARRTERKVSWCENSAGVRVLVWGASAAEPAPWSPAMEDLANLHLYQFTGTKVKLIAYHQLENDTLSVEIAHKSDNVIHIVEQITSHKNGVTLEWLRYEVPPTDERTKLSAVRESVTQASLPAPARTVTRSPCDARLLAACIDGTIHVIQQDAGLMHSTRAGFIATEVVWAGELVLAAEEGGRLQCFDRALALLNHHTKCHDFNSYFKESKRLQVLATTNITGGPLVVVSFVGGPLALVRIMHPRLLTAWVRAGRWGNAVGLLRALDWGAEGAFGLWAVNRLVCDALRGHPPGEACAQAALGAFLAPARALGPAADRFAPAIHDLARKFFHHLLRRGRIEKALSLAVDVADWDLFCDARGAAARAHHHAHAHEAAELAQLYAHAHDQDTDCSDSCSQCSSRSSSGSERAPPPAARARPPPLPRLARPAPAPAPAPAVVRVPIIAPAPPEPASTHSIRPNLHQYLERDNTIWNTAIEDTKPMRWHSVDNVLLNYKHAKHLSPIEEGSSRCERDRAPPAPAPPAHLAPPALHRYRHDEPERTHRSKVKFSNTITIAMVPECMGARGCPSPARELADSLPLSPPHRYLSAFTPLPAPLAAPPAPPPAPPPPPPPENLPAKPPKIKVVNFGMV